MEDPDGPDGGLWQAQISPHRTCTACIDSSLLCQERNGATAHNFYVLWHCDVWVRAGYAPNKAWPHTFMSTAFDLANPPNTNCFWGCVHIFNKQAVAHRLALSALKTVYADASTTVGSGPVVTSVVAAAGAANRVVITYGGGTEGGGLALRSKYGFEVCYSDCDPSLISNSTTGPFFAADIVAHTATTVTIESSVAPNGPIAMVRYAYDDMPSLFYDTQIAVCEYCRLCSARDPSYCMPPVSCGMHPLTHASCLVRVDNKEGLPATPGAYNVTKA